MVIEKALIWSAELSTYHTVGERKRNDLYFETSIISSHKTFCREGLLALVASPNLMQGQNLRDGLEDMIVYIIPLHITFNFGEGMTRPNG